MKNKKNQKPTVMTYMSFDQLKNHKFPIKENKETPKLTTRVTLNPDGTVLTIDHLASDWDKDRSTD